MKQNHIDQNLHINSSCLKKNTLYFTSCNSNILYTLNLDTNIIKPISMIPEDSNKMLFSGLYYYQDCIWMLPWNAKNIYIYNIRSQEIERFLLPIDVSQHDDKVKYRKPIFNGKYLYLLPMKYPGVIKINLNKKSYEIYSKWPNEITFPQNRKMNFKMMSFYNQSLYLYNDEVNQSVRISVEDGEMRIWDIGLNKHFGTINNSRLYIPPVKKYSKLKIYDLNNGKEIRSISFNNEIWLDNEQYYSYWYTKTIKNKIFFMPHEAQRLIMLDINTEAVSLINIDTTDYTTIRDHKNYAIYEIHEYGENFILIPYQGNLVIIIN